ncbi:ThuA domain-containing protein [Amycolatopsis sp. CA-126428]|uniref:ThuA domain-containing protein n=1 Tax=Amycolatopsis sp. CA-126428 TaxID=2073158 RepID=UPI000CD31896|nr:ThuA domain-containing protein [Amycolatopsis sp. CA-126428]
MKGTKRPARALVVRGGWEGHQPTETTDLFVPFLEANGFDVELHDTLEVYTDQALLANTALIVQCWSTGELSRPQLEGLLTAVAAGTGFAGWHGGVVGTFRGSLDYLRLVGGQFVAHPGDFVEHEVVVRPERRDHPVVEGLDHLALNTEQYWVLSDSASDVLATTTIAAGPSTPWPAPVTVPAVWTRRWGAGRIFVSTIGHHLPDLLVPEVRLLTGRGLLWAGAGTASETRD